MNIKKYSVIAASGAAVACVLYAGAAVILNVVAPLPPAQASYRFANFSGKPPIHVLKSAQKTPSGVTPTEIKSIYKLPSTGGHGTIAIVDAYDDATIEQDLNTFSAKYGLPACTAANGCFEKHKMATSTATNSGWALEESLDVEWAHAIAPKAKILLIEAKTPSGANLLAGIDYAASRKDVVAVSLSWGGAEFSDETSLDSHFATSSGKIFFASSGDDGTGASWPAASPDVVGVGGTSLELSSKGTFVSESAWSGSGGGVSAYEPEPSYQHSYSIPKANGHRAIPDVAYDADPNSGYPVYKTTGKSTSGWYTVGGTSAGAPQWAAIQSLGLSVSLQKLYADKASSATSKFFRDITSGANGTCEYYCDARARYDYVTGLGAPQTVRF
ncbi:MAG TPA: S53 family peptidase [Candidatus Paceibacterota bacterium]|jgi:subtilase family serine protease|nr:S53 family peptidase [Candidatus Paceibacterota bacterium]